MLQINMYFICSWVHLHSLDFHISITFPLFWSVIINIGASLIINSILTVFIFLNI